MQLMPKTASDLGLKGTQYATSKAENDEEKQCANKDTLPLCRKGKESNCRSDKNDPNFDERFDPEKNVMSGTNYISTLLKNFNKDERLALAAYNWGPDSVKKNCVNSYDSCSFGSNTQTPSYVNNIIQYKAVLDNQDQQNIATGTVSVQVSSPKPIQGSVSVKTQEIPITKMEETINGIKIEIPSNLDEIQIFTDEKEGIKVSLANRELSQTKPDLEYSLTPLNVNELNYLRSLYKDEPINLQKVDLSTIKSPTSDEVYYAATEF